MSAETLICNAALREAGLNTITGLDEISPTGRACKLFYPMVRDEVLRSHPWNFAQKQRTLGVVELPDAYNQYRFAYSYPTDCMRLNKVVTETNPTPVEFEVMRHPEQEQLVIVTDAEFAVARYTVATENPALFDPIFERAVALALAARLAANLRKDAKSEQQLFQKFAEMLSMARVSDMREGKPQKQERTPWLDARFSGTEREL